MTSGRPPAGQLQASLAALTIGVAKATAARAQAGSASTGEYDQQVRVPLTGVAALAPSIIDKNVTWQLPFIAAPAQRALPFLTPQFTPGIEFTAPTSQLVVITAHVMGWTTNPQSWFVGAAIRFAVQAPAAGSADQVPFAALAHLTFQGYATYPGAPTT
jgi:hypothetical protein